MIEYTENLGDPEVLTKLQLLGLVAMAFDGKIRADAAPSDLFGIEDYVSQIKANPTKGMTAVMRQVTSQPWDGKRPIWSFVMEELRADCQAEKACCMFRAAELQASDARKVYLYDKEHPRVLSPDVVMNARQRLIAAGMLLETLKPDAPSAALGIADVPDAVPETEVA